MSKVLAIGDLHEPFCLDGYLHFCKRIYKSNACSRVVFIGDIIDNHYSSYHETDPDGMGAGAELDFAIAKVRKWYRAFPNAHVTIGNHDRLVSRKAFSAGISKQWVKEYRDVLRTPKWKFVESIDIDNVRYCHGEAKKAYQRAVKDMISVVQGHYHPDAYVYWHVGERARLFGMQVGCGIDHKSYAMAYGKHGPKPAIGCGVIDNGKVATNYLMEL